MELLETAYPEIKFDTPDARPPLRAVLDQCLKEQALDLPRPDEENEQNEPRRLESSLASAPLISFRCPLPLQGAQLRVRLPRRYPEAPLVATVEGAPMLTTPARKAIADSAADEATKLSGELRGEPQCLQVLGEAIRAASDLVESSEMAGGNNASTEAAKKKNDQRLVCGGSSEGPCEQHASAAGRGSNSTEDVARQSSAEPVGGAVFLGRRLIYSHHIIATQKRTGIVKAARELGLGGFSKVSFFFVGLRAVFMLVMVYRRIGCVIGAQSRLC